VRIVEANRNESAVPRMISWRRFATTPPVPRVAKVVLGPRVLVQFLVRAGTTFWPVPSSGLRARRELRLSGVAQMQHRLVLQSLRRHQNDPRRR
jgi:hypothetical protein